MYRFDTTCWKYWWTPLRHHVYHPPEQNATRRLSSSLGLRRIDGVSIRSISSCPMTRSFWKASLLPSNCTASASEGRLKRWENQHQKVGKSTDSDSKSGKKHGKSMKIKTNNDVTSSWLFPAPHLGTWYTLSEQIQINLNGFFRVMTAIYSFNMNIAYSTESHCGLPLDGMI